MVSCCDNDDIFVIFEVVYFNQYLVQGLFMFIVIIVQVCVMLVVDGVDFIDEDDVRCGFFSLFEYVMYMRSVYIDEYFDEVRIGNGKEWYFCFISDCFCQQCFIGIWRVDYQDVFWDFIVQFLEVVWFMQVFYQFVDFFFCFVIFGNVCKSGFDLVFC